MLTSRPPPRLRFREAQRRCKLPSTFHTMACSTDNSLKINIGDSVVDVSGSPQVTQLDLRRAVESTPFKQWIANLKGPRGILTPATGGGASCSLRKVAIQSVDMFGQRVGFLKFKADIIDEATGRHLPGIVFARGGAVGIFILLECNGETYAVLTEQARVPVGRVLLELPAGMLDDDAGDFVGTAAREVEEETGIHIKSADLVNLTNFLDKSTGQQMFPSPGGCDEEISLMLYRSHVKQEVIDSLQDAKVLAAITLYEMAKREGLLPAPPNAPDLSNL
ncbi:hypothetical protein GOP47_0017439 [Adiantum capillus-veneris]|uniref:Nudix hydrolase domain-containing protein n=1 Tax=Adiantum capillus-veneris TaxID=13818 RepID=A0A9D4ZBS1_ADICA|nr:hypothetical protein GOP47_0017439 [Adiantum capillus-veneris]